MQEIWKPIPGYESLYEVSNLGRVRSLDRYVRGVTKSGTECLRFRLGQIRAPQHHRRGYRTVALSKGPVVRTVLIHRLVAEAFVPNPNCLPDVNHVDADKANNSAANLEWCDPAANSAHAKRLGLYPVMHGSQKGSAKLNESAVAEIRALIANGETNVSIARRYGVSTAPISYIRTGKHWQHVP